MAEEFVGSFVDGDGRVVSHRSCPMGMEHEQTREGCVLIPGAYDPATVYFIAGRAYERPIALSIGEFTVVADGTTTLRIELPIDTEVREARRVLGVADDGLFEFVTSRPASYLFELRPPFPYQRQTIMVTAYAP